MNLNGNAGFSGKLRFRVIRANPTRWQRFKDWLREAFHEVFPI